MMAENNTRIWKWMVAILAILNIALLVTLWTKPSPGPPHGKHGPGEGGPAKMIIEELKLSQAQIQEFEKLKEEHHSAVVVLREKGKTFRDQLFTLLKQDQPERKVAELISDSISANQKEIEMVTFDHFEKVRRLCDESQKKRFDEIIGDILHRMSGPPPGGRGRPPH